MKTKALHRASVVRAEIYAITWLRALEIPNWHPVASDRNSMRTGCDDDVRWLQCVRRGKTCVHIRHNTTRVMQFCFICYNFTSSLFSFRKSRARYRNVKFGVVFPSSRLVSLMEKIVSPVLPFFGPLFHSRSRDWKWYSTASDSSICGAWNP